MRRTTKWLALATAVIALVAAPTLAAQRAGVGRRTSVKAHGANATATTTATTKASASKGWTLKASHSKGPTLKTTKVQSSTSKGAATKATKATGPKSSRPSGATKPTAKATTGKKSTTTTSGSTATTSGGTTASGGTTGSATWTPTNPVAEKLSTKPNLLSKVQTSLPAGTDLNAATAGFKNFGQFVAAVNVSNNLAIPFADLKAAMTGVRMDSTSTAQVPVSLGQAIQQLKPGVNAEAEAQHAQTEATQEINSTSTTSTKGKSKSPKRGVGTTTSSGGSI